MQNLLLLLLFDEEVATNVPEQAGGLFICNCLIVLIKIDDIRKDKEKTGEGIRIT
jgi:hypothetical protein